LRDLNHLNPNPDRPELVEGLLFLQAVARNARRKGQSFDKLRTVGFCGGVARLKRTPLQNIDIKLIRLIPLPNGLGLCDSAKSIWF
jgi:hypothetical protein